MADGEGLYLLLLKDAAQAVVGCETQAEALDTTVDLVAQRLSFDVCSIYLVDDAGDLVLQATHGLRKESLGNVRMRPGEGLTGHVFQTETSTFTSSAETHPQFKFFPETGEEGFRSFGGVPLLRRGECIGVLTVQTAREYTFHAHEIVALEALAGQIVGLLGVRRRVEPRGEEDPQLRTAQRMYAGLGTSSGSGLGPAVVRGADDAPPPPRAFTDAETELERFAQARHVAVDVSGERAALADGDARHIHAVLAEILQDGEVERRVRRGIEKGQPVEHAVYRALTACAAELRALPGMETNADEYIDARTELLRALGFGRDEGPLEGVIVAPFLTPAQTAGLDPTRVVAIVTEHGSVTSHASILARTLGIPAVVGVPQLLRRVSTGDRLLVDGDNGFLFVNPDDGLQAEYEARAQATADREQRVRRELAAREAAGPSVAGVELWANVGLPGEMAAAREEGAEGIGLLRSEFFFLLQDDWPSIETQVAFYREALREAPDGPVTIRLLDAGGDKALPYMEPTEEPNPILGLRSVRLLLAHTDLARGQLEALLRAAYEEDADLRILVPLVTAPWELDAIRDMLDEITTRTGLPTRPLGLMVETPAVLFQLEAMLARVNFVSVGTNDLTQYLLAVDRDDERVRHYFTPFQPSVLRALDTLQRELAAGRKGASVCGEMASDPLGALALLALGYRRLSVRPRALPVLRCLVHCVPEERLASLRGSLLAAQRATDVERLLRHELRRLAPFLM